jgi:hypothetical protein
MLGCGVSRHVTDVHAVLVGTATVISSLDEILNVLNASPDLCHWAMEESALAREETPSPRAEICGGRVHLGEGRDPSRSSLP